MDNTVKNDQKITKAELDQLLNDVEFKALIEKSDPKEFTLYEVLQMADYEIRHSNALAWLFDGKAKHNLKYLFLEQFIKRLYKYKENRTILSRSIKIDDIGIFLIKNNVYIDLDETVFDIKREWHYNQHFIDIIIRSEKYNFVIAIENKPGIESTGQLSAYKNNVIDLNFKEETHTRLFVFLTIEGTEPVEKSDRADWVPFDYGEIVKIIDRFILSPDSINKTGNDRITDFIRQYVYNIKKNMLNLYELTREASSLYSKYKNVFDKMMNTEDGLFAALDVNVNQRQIDAIKYILITQSGIKLKLLEHFTRLLKSNGNKILFNPTETSPWCVFMLQGTKEVFDKRGYNGSIVYSLKNTSFEAGYYTKSHIKPVMQKVLAEGGLLKRLQGYGYYTAIYRKDVLTDDDYYNRSFEDLVEIYDSALNMFLKDDVPLIEKELTLLLENYEETEASSENA